MSSAVTKSKAINIHVLEDIGVASIYNWGPGFLTAKDNRIFANAADKVSTICVLHSRCPILCMFKL